MPLPLILGIIGGVAGAIGVGTGIAGGVKMKEANDTMELAKSKDSAARKKLEENSTKTTKSMNDLGNFELKINSSFKRFAVAIEQIHRGPDLADFKLEGCDVPSLTIEELKNTSVAADAILASIKAATAGFSAAGAAAGGVSSVLSTALPTIGGVVYAGGTTAAVGGSVASGVGTALAGAGVSSLVGGSALTGLGVGTVSSVVAGTGAMAGSAVLGAATGGLGFLVGGIVMGVNGSKLSDKADEAYSQAQKNEETINKICVYLNDLYIYSNKYYNSLCDLNRMYIERLISLENTLKRTREFKDFSYEERASLKNLGRIFKLLYVMIRVKLVLKSINDKEMNRVNKTEVDSYIQKAKTLMNDVA